MSKTLAIRDIPDDYTALGADHCNQTGQIVTYILKEITLDELNRMVPSSGGKKTTRTRKTRKTTRKTRNKKFRNRRRKSRKQ